MTLGASLRNMRQTIGNGLRASPKNSRDGWAVVSYQIDGSGGKLVVSDSGTGNPDLVAAPGRPLLAASRPVLLPTAQFARER
jgi:hypothetical protein